MAWVRCLMVLVWKRLVLVWKRRGDHDDFAQRPGSTNASHEATKRNVLVGSGIAVLLIAILAVAGFVTGHGWLFMNLPVEHKVNVFLTDLQKGDYATAYGIWWNDPDWQKHPDLHKDYPLSRFTEGLDDGERLEGADQDVPCRRIEA